jgi:hypothetical protein
MEALAARSPLAVVGDFLRDNVTGADGIDEVHASIQHAAYFNVPALRGDLAALEAVLADPPTDGTLARLVGWDANWALDNPSDAGAIAFLRELADQVRAVLSAVE